LFLDFILSRIFACLDLRIQAVIESVVEELKWYQADSFG